MVCLSDDSSDGSVGSNGSSDDVYIYCVECSEEISNDEDYIVLDGMVLCECCAVLFCDECGSYCDEEDTICGNCGEERE